MNSSKDSRIEALILKIRAGEDDAFSELVSLYTPMMHSAIRRFGLDDDAVFSDACMALYKAALSFDMGQADVTFGLYSQICVTRRILDILRREGGVSVQLSDLDVEDIPVDTDIVSRLLREEQKRELHTYARQLLSGFEHSVFKLWLAGLKTSDIAAELSRDAKAVDNAKARILKKLRDGMSSDGV